MMSRGAGGGAADPTTNNEWPYHHNNDNNNDDNDDDVRFNRPAASSSGNTVANHHPHHQLIKIEQYVHDVLDYSSQYGSDMSISYTAYNVIGTPSQFPDYGDFPETFAMVIIILLKYKTRLLLDRILFPRREHTAPGGTRLRHIRPTLCHKHCRPYGQPITLVRNLSKAFQNIIPFFFSCFI